MAQQRVVLVTGGGSGVGAATSRAFGAGGALVAVNDLRPDAAGDVAREIEHAGGIAMPVPADITVEGEVTSMLKAVTEGLGVVDILVNNAGAWVTRPFTETGPEIWDREISLNFYGVLYCTHAVLGPMIGNGFGRIVSVVSEAARTGERNTAVYAGAKAAVIGFTKSLAKEVGRHGVTANCVALAATRTAAHQGALEDDDLVTRMVRSYPVGRLGEPEDAARGITFLADDASGWITGQTLGVNGGYAMVG